MYSPTAFHYSFEGAPVAPFSRPAGTRRASDLTFDVGVLTLKQNAHFRVEPACELQVVEQARLTHWQARAIQVVKRIAVFGLALGKNLRRDV
jgi:hypothetical protein